MVNAWIYFINIKPKKDCNKLWSTVFVPPFWFRILTDRFKCICRTSTIRCSLDGKHITKNVIGNPVVSDRPVLSDFIPLVYMRLITPLSKTATYYILNGTNDQNRSAHHIHLD